MQEITFEKVTTAHKDLIFEWLEKPHVKEFWDNSQEHRLDIVIFMEGRKEKSPYFNGEHDYHYWIGFVNNDPFCMVMTSELIPSECIKEGSPYVPYLSKNGKTIALDFMIGNESYLGKGLGAQTLENFTLFFKEKVDPIFDTFLIDPGEHNPRAKHVYEKAGFNPVGEYVTKEGYFIGNKSYIMIKKLS